MIIKGKERYKLIEKVVVLPLELKGNFGDFILFFGIWKKLKNHCLKKKG